MELHPNKMLEVLVRGSFLNILGEPIDERIREVRFEENSAEIEYVDGQIVEFSVSLHGVVR